MFFISCLPAYINLIILSFNRSFIHSSINTFIHSFNHPFHLFIQSSFPSFHSIIHSLIHLIINPFIHSFILSFVKSYIQSNILSQRGAQHRPFSFISDFASANATFAFVVATRFYANFALTLVQFICDEAQSINEPINHGNLTFHPFCRCLNSRIVT